MPKPPHIVVSVPPWPAGLEKVRRLASGGAVRFVDSALESGEWPLELIRATRACCFARCRRPTPGDALARMDPAGFGGIRAVARAPPPLRGECVRTRCASRMPAAPTTCRSPNGA